MSSTGFGLQTAVGWRPQAQNVLSVVACLLSLYMVYATLFGPYRTTLVHLGILLSASFVLYFLKDEGKGSVALGKRVVNYACVASVLLCVGHLLLNLERII